MRKNVYRISAGNVWTCLHRHGLGDKRQSICETFADWLYEAKPGDVVANVSGIKLQAIGSGRFRSYDTRVQA